MYQDHGGHSISTADGRSSDPLQRDFGKYYASVSHCPSPSALDLRSCKQIPPHGRWRHLDAGLPRVQPLIEKWNASASPPDIKEVTKRLLDLFLVSVLLDAGAGNAWAYYEAVSEQKFTRSEGLGVASMHMFQEGFFSGDHAQPYRVDGMSRFCRVLGRSHEAATQRLDWHRLPWKGLRKLCKLTPPILWSDSRAGYLF